MVQVLKLTGIVLFSHEKLSGINSVVPAHASDFPGHI